MTPTCPECKHEWSRHGGRKGCDEFAGMDDGIAQLCECPAVDVFEWNAAIEAAACAVEAQFEKRQECWDLHRDAAMDIRALKRDGKRDAK